MHLRSNLRWILAAALLAYAASPAGAQSAGGQLGNPGAGGAADAQVGFQRRAQLKPPEQLLAAGEMVARMQRTSGAVRKQLQQAREQRDVVKTLCLNDKLSQTDTAKRTAEDRLKNLQAAVAEYNKGVASLNKALESDSLEKSNHEFTVLTVLLQRVEQLAAESNQCIGEEAAFIGETKITTLIDPNLPASDDTQYPPTDPTLISGPPLCTSCTL